MKFNDGAKIMFSIFLLLKIEFSAMPLGWIKHSLFDLSCNFHGNKIFETINRIYFIIIYLYTVGIIVLLLLVRWIWKYAREQFFLLHLHEIVHCSLSVCVCVCLSVCPALLVNKIPVERMHRFGRGFGDYGSKVKVTVTLYPFFLHNSLFTSLLCISAFLFSIKIEIRYVA